MALQEITEITDIEHTLRNRGLMVAWINKNLPQTANQDMRTSFCFYDADKNFVFASVKELSDEAKRLIEEQTSVRFWSKGIV